jgi:serine/threonine-protein phosphatase 6 regulatory ankyrin repeat subunit B
MEDWEKEFLRTAIRSRPVFKAAREGHEGEVARLLDADATLLEAMDSDGDRLLAVAAEHGHLGLVRLLLQRGADAAVRVRWASFNMNEFWASKGTQIFGGTTPLIIACDKGHMAVLQLLLEHRQGQGLEEKDDVWGRTALHSAAQRGHEEVTAYLLDNGAQADSRDDNSSTPLIIASKNGHLGVVRVLVQHIGAHNLIGTQGLEARDKGGMTALAWAAEQGYEEMVAFLLLKGALADRLDNTRDTPFLKACAKGHLGVVQMLLEHVGVEQGLQGRGRYSRTALHHAAANGHEDVAAFLFSKGADASARNAHGETPLMLACRAGRAGMVSRILRHTGGLGLDESDDSGRTAVRHAIEEARKEILSLLLLAGADPTIAGNDGTPRDIAQNRGSRKDWAGCVEVLDVSQGES